MNRFDVGEFQQPDRKKMKRDLYIPTTVACIILTTVACIAPPASARAGSRHSDAAPSAVQCRRTDRDITKQIRFERGRTTAAVKDTVRLCTAHEYRLRARGGQTMSVNLATGTRTGFSIYTPAGDIIADADGVKQWSGELPQTGQYVIRIGTDATAAYTLEVTIR
jgi:hypothetical protein